jgi:hypothetical protein
MPCDIYVKLQDDAKRKREQWASLAYSPEMAGYSKTGLVKAKRDAMRKWEEANKELSLHAGCKLCMADGIIPKRDDC